MARCEDARKHALKHSSEKPPIAIEGASTCTPCDLSKLGLLGPKPPQLCGPISHDVAILLLRYPISRDTFSVVSPLPPKRCDTPFTSTDINVRYPILQKIANTCAIPPNKHKNTKERGDAIATRIARYERYRCGASSCAF